MVTGKMQLLKSVKNVIIIVRHAMVRPQDSVTAAQKQAPSIITWFQELTYAIYNVQWTNTKTMVQTIVFYVLRIAWPATQLPLTAQDVRIYPQVKFFTISTSNVQPVVQSGTRRTPLSPKIISAPSAIPIVPPVPAPPVNNAKHAKISQP